MPDSIDFAALTILVIDDQDFVRTIVRKMLQQLGIGTVIEAHDGHSGLEVAAREKPDVVVCDIQMRPLDGFGFIQKLRATEGISHIPVIMLTAHTDTGTMGRARELSIDAFLTKPVLPPALKEKIVRVLSQSKADA